MSKKILILRHPSGIKKTVQCIGSMTFDDLFQTVSKQFGLDSEKHELKLGPETLNMNVILEHYPETAVLDITPKCDGRRTPVPQVLVQLCFADEGDQYEFYTKVMNSTDTLWNVVKELVPDHMAYVDENVSLKYLGMIFRGKRRLRQVKLGELCGVERRLFFTCSRDYLQTPYNRQVGNVSTGVKESSKKRGEIPGTNVDLDPVGSNEIGYETLKALTIGNLNPYVIELSERRGRIYKKFSVDLNGENEIVSGFASSDIEHEQGEIVVSVVFPNQILLEGLFFTRESIQDVKNWIDKYLISEAKNFYLYTIRPRLIPDPERKLETMKSNPPGFLWFSGKLGGNIFTNDVEMTLKGQVFTYVSGDSSERSQIRAASSSYMWSPQADE